ncbi:PTS system mannose/fructose/N-acetylgalactosamine-transporter subunit IIB [Tepidanaerobacter acetatoxydans]|uniref:PTS system mannose/fructose/N-acetylgalactosamine-transporter subunit IIB n=1 Tax=Tepidanaerobacter acetatoxydans TaxID=499229 RepID=UPI001BD2224A|nr:PTS sugar transporter subunit IIB [Tepidanaerobacter acetatoxydans]
MGEIVLARVDDRLIHGQVMTKWSKGLNCNAIFVIDNSISKDPLMKSVYEMSAGAYGLTIKVMSVDEAIKSWEENKFWRYKVILLFKNISTVKETVNKGLPIQRLNIGGIAKKADSTFIIPSVALTKLDADILRELNQNYGIEVTFQTLPDTKKVSLKDALDNSGL